MANSGSKYGSVSQRSSVYRTHIYWYVKSSNPMTNKSKVNVALYIDRVNTAYQFEGTVSGISITVNSTSFTKANYYQRAYNSNWSSNHIKIFSTDIDITHNSVGAANINIAAACTIKAGGWGPGLCKINSTGFNLDTLDRNPPSVTNLRTYTLGKTTLVYDVTAVKASGMDWAMYSLNGGSWINSPNDSTIRNLTPNTTYTLKVKYRSTVNGLWGESNTLTFTTLPNDTTPPTFVSATVKPITNTVIYAMSEWTAAVDGMKEIKVSIDGGTTYNKLQGNITGLTGDTTYSVKFKATGNNDISAESEAFSVTTKPDPIVTQEVTGSWKNGITQIKTNGEIDD